MKKLQGNPMKESEGEEKKQGGEGEESSARKQKPPFRLVKDDTKPTLRDPILRSDPIETEEAILRLPPFPLVRSSVQS
ncbi:uncharacterized protein LOC143877873 [Tasmannia lanceolata]|uniref:uncharacterized protein LOC143877873 n=1 Tax=Tasmannia lanceolata TaxID=3420 RepID=UPI0040646C95